MLNSNHRGTGRGKTAGDLGERVPRVPRDIHSVQIALFSQFPGGQFTNFGNVAGFVFNGDGSFAVFPIFKGIHLQEKKIEVYINNF